MTRLIRNKIQIIIDWLLKHWTLIRENVFVLWMRATRDMSLCLGLDHLRHNSCSLVCNFRGLWLNTRFWPLTLLGRQIWWRVLFRIFRVNLDSLSFLRSIENCVALVFNRFYYILRLIIRMDLLRNWQVYLRLRW